MRSSARDTAVSPWFSETNNPMDMFVSLKPTIQCPFVSLNTTVSLTRFHEK
jgi:hypothetical protein